MNKSTIDHQKFGNNREIDAKNLPAEPGSLECDDGLMAGNLG